MRMSAQLQIDPKLETEFLTDTSVPDAILPEQFFGRPEVRADTPEKRLMLAVLLDAIIHLQRRDTEGSAEAARWIQAENDDGPFAFQSICTALGIEPSYLARGLLQWHASRSRVRVRVPTHQLGTRHQRVRPPRRRRRRTAAAVNF